MTRSLSSGMKADIQQSVSDATATSGIVNVARLAAEIRFRHEVDNVALEDVEAAVMAEAQAHSAAMEFDSGHRATQESGTQRQTCGTSAGFRQN